MKRLAMAFALAFAACGGDDGVVHDAGLDAIRDLAITVEGSLAMPTYTVAVTIEANGTTRNYTFPVAGLPATVEFEAPIQLSDWNITVDAKSMSAVIIGRGMKTVPSGTAATSITVTPVP